ncbi:MAG: carbamoyl-phosphate synthase large subunit, partial [Actinoplanes sp.]|nr:carbamoyl-phosphate synthase large subunit [Actinoplanes sp.]
FGPDFQPVTAEMTASCSALTSILALSALALVALRQRSQALIGFLAAGVFVLLANQLRLILSLLAGRYFAVDALVFFHDWIGAMLSFAYTLIGLLIMIGLTMHDRQRAEQDRSGRHTANRPGEWGRPGMGHRVEIAVNPNTPKVQIAAFLHRRVLPASVSDWLAARREQRRVDYRVGHQSTRRRTAAVRDLAERGLGVHTATLLAVATHETDPAVLDALADAIAARQWEPISHRDVVALRLWARAWLMRAPVPGGPTGAGRLIAVTGAGGPAGVAVIRAIQAAGDRALALDADPDAVGLRLASSAAVVPRADEPGYAEAVLAALDEYRPVALICTVAEEYASLAPLADRLAELGTKTWLPDPVAADTCLDKVAFAAVLRAAGVPHPPTVRSAHDAVLIPGPWVVKPARGRGSRDVVFVDDARDLEHAFAVVPDAIAQTRLPGLEFTADALVARDGTLLTCVPRWRDETRGGISVRGTTFDSTAVTEVVAATLRAIGYTGPANVQGFVADPRALAGDPDFPVVVGVVEVNPRFSGGLPLTLAAGADVVGTYLAGILDPAAELPRLTYRPGVRMARHFAEVYYAGDGSPVADPLAPAVAR